MNTYKQLLENAFNMGFVLSDSDGIYQLSRDGSHYEVTEKVLAGNGTKAVYSTFYLEKALSYLLLLEETK